MSEANRSLRRKPPPPTDVYDAKNAVNNIPEETQLPQMPFMTPEKTHAPFQQSFKSRPQISLTVNPDLSYDSAYGQENDDYAGFAGYAEDLLLSYESPRLKGPQDLPFDEEGLELPPPINALTLENIHALSEPSSPILIRKPAEYLSPLGNGLTPILEDTKPSASNGLFSHRNSSYRQRKFQNLLQRGTSPFNILESDEEESREYFEPGIPDPKQSIVHTPLPKQLPYPLEDRFSSGEENEENEQSFDHSITNGSGRTSAPIDFVGTTPTRIPSLVQKDSMRILARPTLTHKTSSPEFRFLRNSPPRLINLPSTSPELHLYNYLSSPLSSPTRVSLYGRLPPRYSGYGDSRTSRSPSPKKYAGTSPPSKPGFYAYEDTSLGGFEDDINQERVPRWSLIENDEDDYYDDSFIMPPAETQFDYTILPELPSLVGDSLHDSIFGSLQLSETSPLQHTLTMRRKNDELPPVPLDLPLLPFLPSVLTSLHFVACPNVWSLSNIFQWCLQLKGWMHGETISIKEFRKVLMKLTAFHKQDVPIDLISRNVSRIIDSFTENKLLIFEPDSTSSEKQKSPHFLFNENGSISGVLVDLTSCYCTDEDHKQKGRRDFTVKCYSSQCLINKTIEHELLMRSTNINELVLGLDWASHWKLAAQDMAIDLSESRRQSFLFDLIKFEQNFIQRAECFIDVAGPEFLKLAKLVVGSTSLTSMKEFGDKIMNAAKELLSIHRKSLFEPLLKILVTDGKFIKDISGIAELYIEWAKSAKSPLLSYISAMPMIEDLLRNNALKRWDELIRLNPRIKELQVNGNLLLISTFNSRYQQLPLQLLDVRKYFDEEDEEYVSLTKAVEAIRQLGNKVNEMKVYSDNIHALRLVEKQLTWKSSVFKPRLNLKSSRRKFFYRGDLIRKGDLKINSHSIHVIVLDNYLLITDKQRTQRSNTYKVTETPIPLDYLIVENREKESHGLSVKTSPINTSVNNGDGVEEESSSFPFKIRYAGRKGESHILIASTEKERKKWFSILMQTKANLLKRVLPSTPYNFELVANAFFSYDHASRMTKLPIFCTADPISILAKKAPASGDSKRPSVQRNVQCSEMFSFRNENFVFLGTNAGVYCSDGRNTWKKIINMNNVAKVTVISELNIVLVLANRSLRYYPLQLLINIYYEKKDKITSYQLSNEGILFYEFGCHRGLPMVFVAKRKTAAITSFKVYVLELDNVGIFSAFTTLKRFYIQAECHGISVFNSSVAVHTQRGFEVLDLQKLAPRNVPELPTSDSSSKKLDGYSRKKAVQSTDFIKKLVSHATSMGMFKLNNNKEFLMVYSECAIFVNKSGKLSRTSIVHFDFKPKSIAFKDNNLVLVCEEVIEVWSISSSADGTNKLIQVIPSKGLHLLDPQTLCFNLANPENADLQLIFKMVAKPENPLLS